MAAERGGLSFVQQGRALMEKDEKAGKTRLDRARSRGSEPSKSASSYADGAPLDRVQYR
jgi:hypothetical protein